MSHTDGPILLGPMGNKMTNANSTDGDQLTSRPRFCPSCRTGRPEGGRLCPACGDELIDQGYCPICEEHWMLRVGAICPKHDVDLEEHGAAPLAGVESGGPVNLVTVGTYSSPIAAEALRIRLEAEGIPTFLQGERMG